MSVRLHRPAAAPDANGVVVNVSPANAGWSHASMRVVAIAAHGAYEFATGESEWIVLPLSGSVRVFCDGHAIDVEGRESVFDRVSDFAYVPRGSGVTVASEDGARVAVLGAVCERALPFRRGLASEVPVELRGAGSASRQCNNFAAPGAFETDRLVAVEVLVPGGNWASYPPHKHDEQRDGEAQLEEIYYFEVAGGADGSAPGPGGYQRVYTSGPGREIDVVAEVKSGDVVLIPFGYHGPTMAAPDYDLYFLNVLAGPAPGQTMAFCDDPVHAWVRESWRGADVDPRLPMTTHEGRA
ncbi:MAG TPA: 5-deoxy-glucuronate isomerase [Acidimicrobiales bacterium]|nr:5-deoxy-glucuronate isomerase [Acidimicrobiales bacterium]